VIKPITPCLWFDGQAEEAANVYCSIFEDSEIVSTVRNSEANLGEAGTVLVVEFKLNGQPFQAMNGGPEYEFTPAISFSVLCADQKEVDHYWDSLLVEGKAIQCGWLVDKFGVSWQVVPEALPRLLGDSDRERANKVMEAMMQMVKLDVAELEAAFNS
jgi:predicted 3-demethylubiquinone-9 3-methyltransferase (glyoxalase superfamily)